MSGSGRPLGCWEASRAFATLSLMVVVLHTGAATGEEIKLGVPGVKGPAPGVALPKVKGPELAPSATQPSPKLEGVPSAAPGGSAVERTIQSEGLREGLRAAASPKLRIHSMGLPSDVKVVGDALQLTFNIGVANQGDADAVYQLAGTVPGGQRPRLSEEYSVAAGETQRVSFQFETSFTPPAEGKRLPVTIVLRNAAGRRLGARTAHVEVPEPSSVARIAGGQRADRASLVRTTGPDLAVSRMTVAVRRRDPGQDALHIATYGIADSGGPMTRITAVVDNTGSERWGYRGHLGVRFHEGTPQAGLRAVNGMAGFRIDLPAGLQPGEQTTVQGGMASALSPGFWYTANIQIFADADTQAANDVATLVFFVEEDGRVTQRGGNAAAESFGRQLQRLQEAQQRNR